MVLIIPSSGCLDLDSDLISRQMLNIHYNRDYFSLSTVNGNCTCIHDTVHNDQIDYQANVPKFIDTDTKFNTYEIHNSFDPSNTITVEPFLNVGNIVVYVNDLNAYNYVYNNIIKKIKEHYDIAKYDVLKMNKPVICVNSYNYIQSDEHVMLYTEETEINFHIELKNCKKKHEDCHFVWKIFIINSYDDIISFIESHRTSYLLAKNNKIVPFLNFYKINSIVGEYSILCSPSTIILDAVKLFPNKVLKQLDFPTVNQTSSGNLITNCILISQKMEIDASIINHYIKENNITKRIQIKLCHIPYRENIININENYFTTVSWSHDENIIPDETSSVTYYLNFNNNFNLEKNLAYDYEILTNLCKMASNSDKYIAYLNKPDKLCYVTGVPLYDYYYEIQFISQVPLNKETDATIIVCMQITRTALIILSTPNSIYEYNIMFKYIKNGELSFHLDYLFCIKNKYRQYKNFKKYNIVVKYSSVRKIDIIYLIKSKPERDLFLTMEKFGIMSNQALYSYNPETNILYIGILHTIMSDVAILSNKSRKNCILFMYNSDYFF